MLLEDTGKEDDDDDDDYSDLPPLGEPEIHNICFLATAHIGSTVTDYHRAMQKSLRSAADH